MQGQKRDVGAERTFLRQKCPFRPNVPVGSPPLGSP